MWMLRKWIGMLHMLQWLYTYVASFLLLMFQLFFHAYVVSVFIWILHVFHTYIACVYLDVAYNLQWFFQTFSGVFTNVSDLRCKCFDSFWMYVANVSFRCCKLDRVLNLPPRRLLPRLGVFSSSRCWWCSDRACVETCGVDGASRSSGAKSKRGRRVERSRCGVWGTASGRAPRAGRSGASLL
jgi:hypothetical protein